MNIAVLTGGGDCPGLNAAIRAVVRKALEYGDAVLGLKNGWAGLVKADTMPLDAQAVAGILPAGGTILGTSRTNPLKKEEDLRAVEENWRALGIDALVAIGGDDTLSVAYRLHQMGYRVVGVPKTMDNDVRGTDYCIGFDSAVTTVVEALDKLHTTASAHHRVMVVEVMGRDAGWVAVVGGLAGGADYILIPEVPVHVEEVCAHLRRRRERGKDSSIIVVAEGAKIEGIQAREPIAHAQDAFGHVRLDTREIGHALGAAIERMTGFETRVTVLGHIQRGGSPSVFDRVLATRLGVAAVQYIHEGRFGYMPALQANKIVPVPLEEVVKGTRGVDLELYELAKIFY